MMRTPLVFDGRNIYDVPAMGAAGVEYHSVGRKVSNKDDAEEIGKVDSDLQQIRQ